MIASWMIRLFGRSAAKSLHKLNTVIEDDDGNKLRATKTYVLKRLGDTFIDYVRESLETGSSRLAAKSKFTALVSNTSTPMYEDGSLINYLTHKMTYLTVGRKRLYALRIYWLDGYTGRGGTWKSGTKGFIYYHAKQRRHKTTPGQRKFIHSTLFRNNLEMSDIIMPGGMSGHLTYPKRDFFGKAVSKFKRQYHNKIIGGDRIVIDDSLANSELELIIRVEGR